MFGNKDIWLRLCKNSIISVQHLLQHLFCLENIVSITYAELEVYAPGRLHKQVLDATIGQQAIGDDHTLIVQGTRDRFGTTDEVRSYALSSSIEVVWLEDGDHSFTPRKKSGRTLEQNLEAGADAAIQFIRRLG